MALAALIAPILCYHRIGGPLELGVTRVGSSVFARQMTALAQAGWRTMTLEEFGARNDAVRARHGVPLHQSREWAARTTHDARRTFLLTFDDGYASLAEHAYPILADLGFTATTFLITDYVGKTNDWDVRYTWNRLRHLSWETVERWRERKFDFASHGATHRRLTWLSDRDIESDLQRSRETLTVRLGPDAARAIAYPFGAVDARVEALARQAGFELGFGGVRGTGSALHLPRVPVYFWDSGDVPFGLRHDTVGVFGRTMAHVANRCAIGTTLLQAIGYRVSAIGRVVPDTR